MLKSKEDIEKAFKAFSELKHCLIGCYGPNTFQSVSDIVSIIVDAEQKFRKAVRNTDECKAYEADSQKRLNEWCENYRKSGGGELRMATENCIRNLYGDSWEKDPDTGDWHRTSWGV